jgi:glycosyltransferase involved in cell wall biosynthesis
MIENMGGGITVNSDLPAEIASGILRYMDNPDLLRKHGEDGYEAVVREFNWNRDLDRLTGLYRRILDEAPATIP